MADIEDFFVNRLPRDEVWSSSNTWRWENHLLAPDQFIPDPDPMNKRAEDLQLTRGDLKLRYHGRFWNFPADAKVIGSVHMDAIRAIGHRSADFESIERFFAALCRRNNNWVVHENAEDLANVISGYKQPFNNGRATVIDHA